MASDPGEAVIAPDVTTLLSKGAGADDPLAFCDSFWETPLDRLIAPAEPDKPSTGLDIGDANRREYQIWQGYIDASCLLLEEMLKRGRSARHLIFPAMFNLRHALEVALKWHIRYAGGEIPRRAGHDLGVLIEAFRKTAEGLDHDATYAEDGMLDLIAELATLDPRSTKFRYAPSSDVTAVLAEEQWDLRKLYHHVAWLSVWLDHLSGYIDMSCPEYQAMLRELDSQRLAGGAGISDPR